MPADDSLPRRAARETVYETPDFTVQRDTVTHPDGRETDVHYVSEPPAVTVLPFTPDGDVVTIAEWRASVDRITRSIPGGSMEPEDDDRKAAARRELREESGYAADSFAHLATREPAPGLADSVRHYFVARDCEPTESVDLDADESITVEVREYGTLLDAAVAGDLRNGRLAAALCQYELLDRA